MPRNGRAGHGALRRMPVRTMRIELEGDYADFSLVMRANPPLRVFTSIQGNEDFAGLRDLVSTLIVDWDFVDEDGNAIPVGELEALPLDLIGMIITRYLATISAATTVPKA